MANRHLIGKQILELKVNSSDNIYALQQKMSELVWKDLLPELGKLFDSMVREDEVIRIDCVQLDLGAINLNDTYNKADIVDKIVNLLEEKIKEKLQDYKEKDSALKSGNKDKIEKPSSIEMDHQINEKESVLKQYLKENTHNNNNNNNNEQTLKKNQKQLLRSYYFDLWLHWLEKGALPPYSIEPEENWMELVLETLAIDLDAVGLVENKLRKRPVAMRRLVLQHSSKDLKSIVELYTAISQVKLLAFFNELKQLLTEKSLGVKSLPYRELEISAWMLVFDKVILQRKKLDSIALGLEIIKIQELDKLVPELKNISKDKNTSYPFLQVLSKEKTFLNPKEITVSEPEIKTAADSSEDDMVEQMEIIEDVQLESPLFFKNAGVVLIHPFLGNFFKNLGFLEENSFKDFHCQSKAVALLHFLATGEENPLEYEMILPKFLCEMPANIPIDHTLVLTDEEKEEAHSLLLAAIAHWGVLQGTSPDGLREGFLCREGKLEKEETGWKLHVEQKTLDILLDRLPWNLGLIKLPWMTELLKVEWR
jgi:hypothetical protein